MQNWWESISGYQQVLFVIAVATTVIMFLQVIMILIGGAFDDASFNIDTDFDGGDVVNEGGFSVFGLKILSARTVLAFFSIGSWVTFTLLDALPEWASTLLGVVGGLCAAFLVAYLLKVMEKFQEAGNVEIKNAVGKAGEVYLTIPANRAGVGKVNLFLQERFVEYDAISDAQEPLKTGSKIKVTGVLNEGTLIVE